MKRTIFSLLLCVVLLFSLALTVCAEGPSLIVDEAKLVSVNEEATLNSIAATMGETYRMDFVIVTTNTLNGKTPEQYADDYYDENGYGEDGILLLVSMEDRDWYISTCGEGIYALTDYGIQKISEAFLKDLSAGRYSDAFTAYLNALVPYLVAYRNGSPIDGYADLSGENDIGTREKVVYAPPSIGKVLFRSLLRSSLFGLGAALIVICILRSTMNTRQQKTPAGVYLKENSFHIQRNQDMFLHSNVVKTSRQDSSSGSSSGHHHSGGGSSVHRSSSGRSHGGGGGKF